MENLPLKTNPRARFCTEKNFSYSSITMLLLMPLWHFVRALEIKICLPSPLLAYDSWSARLISIIPDNKFIDKQLFSYYRYTQILRALIPFVILRTDIPAYAGR